MKSACRPVPQRTWTALATCVPLPFANLLKPSNSSCSVLTSQSAVVFLPQAHTCRRVAPPLDLSDALAFPLGFGKFQPRQKSTERVRRRCFTHPARQLSRQRHITRVTTAHAPTATGMVTASNTRLATNITGSGEVTCRAAASTTTRPHRQSAAAAAAATSTTRSTADLDDAPTRRFEAHSLSRLEMCEAT